MTISQLAYVTAVCDGERNKGILLYQKNGHAFLVDFTDGSKDALDKFHGWFVHQRQLWLRHEHAPCCKHLLFTTRQRAPHLLAAFLETSEKV